MDGTERYFLEDVGTYPKSVRVFFLKFRDWRKYLFYKDIKK
jgi:hypothetical protein